MSGFAAFLQGQMEEGLRWLGAGSPPASGEVVAEADAISFAAPPGYQAEPASLEIHRQALKLQNEQRGRMSYIDAVREVTDPARKEVREKRQSLSEEVPVPAGFQADAASLDLHNRAVKLQRANPDLSYMTAVRLAGLTPKQTA